MDKSKRVEIELEFIVKDKTKSRKFELGHAERILRLHRQGGYQLPSNSKYEFVKNGLQLKSN